MRQFLTNLRIVNIQIREKRIHGRTIESNNKRSSLFLRSHNSKVWLVFSEQIFIHFMESSKFQLEFLTKASIVCYKTRERYNNNFISHFYILLYFFVRKKTKILKRTLIKANEPIKIKTFLTQI